jgi:3',5'-cyclic AMP phosphodiesterase CpdA
MLKFICAIAFSLAFPLLAAEPVVFVQMTDPQLGMGAKGYADDLAKLQQAVEQANKLNPSFTVVCGDVTDKWTKEAGTDVAGSLKKLTSPWYLAPGNHDGWKTPEYTPLFGADRRLVEAPGLTLIVINTDLWKGTDAVAGDAEIKWLEEALVKAADRKLPIIVAGHHPLFVGGADKSSGVAAANSHPLLAMAVDEAESYHNLPPLRRNVILALFEKYKVAAYLSGHMHYSATGTYHGITLVSCPSLAKNFSGEKPGFYLWRLDANAKLTYEYVPLAKTSTAKAP